MNFKTNQINSKYWISKFKMQKSKLASWAQVWTLYKHFQPISNSKILNSPAKNTKLQCRNMLLSPLLKVELEPPIYLHTTITSDNTKALFRLFWLISMIFYRLKFWKYYAQLLILSWGHTPYKKGPYCLKKPVTTFDHFLLTSTVAGNE